MCHFKTINCVLKEEDHKYIFEEGINPIKIISGSSFFKKELTEEEKNKVLPYGKVALPIGTGIHKSMENILNWYFETRDIDTMYKLVSKYKESMALFSNILQNTLHILEVEGFNSWEAEKTQGILTNKNIAFCGTGDGFINNKILIDYKSIGFNKYENLKEMFFLAFQDIIDEKIGRNEHKGYSYYTMIKYVYQFGLYSVILNAQVIYMIIGDANCIIKLNELEVEILKQHVINKIHKEY